MSVSVFLYLHDNSKSNGTDFDGIGLEGDVQ